MHIYMDVSENSGTPKSSILIGFSIINHPFWGTRICGNTDISIIIVLKTKGVSYHDEHQSSLLLSSLSFVDSEYDVYPSKQIG